MAKCPKCGIEVTSPYKTWYMVTRPGKTGERWKLMIGLFECSGCGAKFRAITGKEKASIKSMAERIKGIEEELVQVLRNLREKIRALETERASLLTEIEELKKEAEARVSALESEVSALRNEVKALKELLSRTE